MIKFMKARSQLKSSSFEYFFCEKFCPVSSMLFKSNLLNNYDQLNLLSSVIKADKTMQH